MEVFGVWNEAIDGLWDGETNSICVEGLRYEARELCALIHTRGAKTLGVYGEDFYKGEPALTVNSFGKGKAYYLAASAEDGFYRDFYGRLVKETGAKRALNTQLPEGVEACLREDGDRKFVFLQNFSGEEQAVCIPAGWESFESGKAVEKAVLPPYGSTVLRGRTK